VMPRRFAVGHISPFACWPDDRFIGVEPPLEGARVEFLRGPRGQIQFIRRGGRLASRQ
jgi:hypothetical protein